MIYRHLFANSDKRKTTTFICHNKLFIEEERKTANEKTSFLHPNCKFEAAFDPMIPIFPKLIYFYFEFRCRFVTHIHLIYSNTLNQHNNSLNEHAAMTCILFDYFQQGKIVL